MHNIVQQMIFVDQITKLLALVLINGTVQILPGFLSLRLVHNTGMSFSLPINPEYAVAFKVVTAVFLLGLSVYYSLTKDRMSFFQEMAFEFIIAGGISNAIDRLVYSGVVDFISISIFGYNLFVCNFADIFLTIGGIMLFMRLFSNKPRQDGENYKNILFKENNL